MAYRGQQIYNPLTGEHITFLRTTAETNGEQLVFNCRVDPGKVSLPPHVHDTQEERFEVISGTLGVMVGGEKFLLRAGDKAILPVKVKHQWWNAGEDEVEFRVEVSPARNLEMVLEAIAGLVADGKMNKRCMPKNPFLLAQFGKLGETYLPVVPIWMQKIGLTMGTITGRVLGYDPTFAAYRTAAVEAEKVAA